jgi:hypothetical protein
MITSLTQRTVYESVHFLGLKGSLTLKISFWGYFKAKMMEAASPSFQIFGLLYERLQLLSITTSNSTHGQTSKFDGVTTSRANILKGTSSLRLNNTKMDSNSVMEKLHF